MPASTLSVVFLKTLSDAIEAVPVNQDARQRAVAAFDSVEAQTKTCCTEVQMENITVIGTPTLSTNNSIYRISLTLLQICFSAKDMPLLISPLKKALLFGNCHMRYIWVSTVSS